MGLFRLGINYDGRLSFTEDHRGNVYTINIDDHVKILMSSFGMDIEIERYVPQNVREDLVRGITKVNKSLQPNWHNVTSVSHHFLSGLRKTFWETAIYFDGHLRKSPSALRLPAVSLPLINPASNNRWTIATWEYSDEELDSIKEIEEFRMSQRHNREVSLPVPLPKVESRQCYLSKDDCQRIVSSVHEGENTHIAYRHLSMAWNNFEQGMYNTATVMAAITIETSIKSYLSRQNKLVERILERMSSPQLKDLVECACEICNLNFPIEKRNGWLQEISKIRNKVVHQPQENSINMFEAARALAISEGLLKSIEDIPCDPQVGLLINVNPTTHSNGKRLPINTTGIILRREVTWGEDGFHILINTGQTDRFALHTFTVPIRQKLEGFVFN